MRIIVVGAGGVGGFFGGKIAKTGYDVTFIARGEHLQAIKKNGLHVKSIDGDFTVHPKATDNINEISDPDLILLGVKSWQVVDVAKQIKPIVTENTMVLPLQNGADNADKLLTVLDKKNVLAGLSKIVSKIESPGVIDHFAFEPQIVFGEYDNVKTERLESIKTIFDSAGFKNAISDDIHLDIWRKFLFIATVSGIGALTRTVFGVMREDDAIRDILTQTANEIKSIANAKGIQLTQRDIEIAFNAIDNTDYDTTASMQRDIMEGRPSELHNFNGYIVEQREKLKIETPVNAFIYNCLLPQEKKARKLL